MAIAFSDVIKLYKEGIKPKDIRDMLEIKKEFDQIAEENPDEINVILNAGEVESGETVNYHDLYEQEKAEREKLSLELSALKDDMRILNAKNEDNLTTIKELQASLSHEDISDAEVSAIDINNIIKDNL